VTTFEAAERPRSRRKWDAAADAILDAFAARADEAGPVYLRLKATIAALVQSGALPAATQLPPEQWLARALGVSLGTAQKALNALHGDGVLERRQGHGTYVAAPRRPMTELWHYRFFDPETGAFAPVFSHLIRRRIVEDASLPAIIGRDPAGYVEIERLIDVAGEATCHSRLLLGATHFAPLMKIAPSVFENVNLKSIFASDFGRPTLEAVQRLHLAPPSPRAQKTLQRPEGELSMVLTVVAHSHAGPYSYQEAHIPPSRFRLDMSLAGDTPARGPRA